MAEILKNKFVYILGSVSKKCPCFFRIFRKLARTKTKQITDKASRHNGRTVLLCALVLLRRVSTVVVSTSSFILNPFYITLPHNLHQLPFSPPPPQPTECASTDRVCLPLGSGRHAKSYDRVAPRPPNKADMKTKTYPAEDEISANHRASGDASVIATCCLQQITPPPPPRLRKSFSTHWQ